MSSSWNSRFYFAGRYYQKSACSELFHSDFPILSNTIWQSCSRQNRRSSALFCLVKSSKWPWLSCNLADVLQRCWVAALVGTQERSFFSFGVSLLNKKLLQVFSMYSWGYFFSTTFNELNHVSYQGEGRSVFFSPMAPPPSRPHSASLRWKHLQHRHVSCHLAGNLREIFSGWRWLKNFHDVSVWHTVDGSEIRRSPIEVDRFSHFLQGFIYIPGGCLGFLSHQPYDLHQTKQMEVEALARRIALMPTAKENDKLVLHRFWF